MDFRGVTGGVLKISYGVRGVRRRGVLARTGGGVCTGVTEDEGVGVTSLSFFSSWTSSTGVEGAAAAETVLGETAEIASCC